MVFIGALFTGMAVFLGVIYLTPLWDCLARRQMGDRIRRFERLGIDSLPIQIGLRIWGICLGLVFCGVWWGLRMPPVALAMTWLVYIAASYVLDALIRQRTRLLRDQMVLASQGLGNTVKAGIGLAQGMESVAEEISEPLSCEFRRIVADFHRGRPLVDAIAAAQQRLQTESFILFGTALQVAIQQGGRITEALLRISHSLQESQRLDRKLQADTASGLRVIQLLALFPLGYLILMHFVARPEVQNLYTTLLGQLILAAVIMIDYFGVRMAVKMLHKEL